VTKLQTIAENVRSTKRILRNDFDDYLQARRSPATVGLSAEQERVLADMRRDGYAVVENYWPRDDALAMRDTLEAYLQEGRDRDFDEGAWLRFWDARSYDQGVRRIYHVEKLVPELTSFRYDPFVLGVASAYYGVPFHSGVLVFQHNTQTNEQTRYYHVDAFIREFKSFVYLDDVDEGNGPFAYLRGTQRHHFTRLRKQVVGNAEGESPTSFYEDDIRSVLDREVRVCGPAGTLILADVRGLHRGTPQVDRSRSVLVNYIVRHEGDLVLDK
jgi:phytanoyl-CoA dioxygenase PhyH